MICRKLSIIAIHILGLALLPCGLARANLVINGNFNLYGGSAPKNDFVYVQPTDWTGSGLYDFGVEVDAPGTADNVSDPGIPVYGPFPVHGPSGNNNFIEADGDPSYSFSFNQTISGLTVGQNYDVSFNQAAGQQSGNLRGPTTEQWQVSLGSDTQLSAVMNTPSRCLPLGVADADLHGQQHIRSTELSGGRHPQRGAANGFSGWRGHGAKRA